MRISRNRALLSLLKLETFFFFDTYSNQKELAKILFFLKIFSFWFELVVDNLTSWLPKTFFLNVILHLYDGDFFFKLKFSKLTILNIGHQRTWNFQPPYPLARASRQFRFSSFVYSYCCPFIEVVVKLLIEFPRKDGRRTYEPM